MKAATPVALLVLGAAAAAACAPARALPPGDYHPRETPALRVSSELRLQALRRAQVWQEPSLPIDQVDFAVDPPGLPATELTCRFLVKHSTGLTPKFACILPGGEVVKVKYGRYNTEPQAEVAATRLMTALGFGADRMHVVRRVNCFGCPPYPYPRQAWLDSLLADFSRSRPFEDVAVEQLFPGREIESESVDGWIWSELDQIDSRQGGASQAELDALRLMAVFLNHWDNKAANQRLVCTPGTEAPDGSCGRPFAFVQDLGASFGPWKVELEGWRRYPIWADRATCRVSLRALPFEGATFPETRIGEGGRRLLASLLEQLRTDQIRQLFVAARFDAVPEGVKDVDRWVEAFHDRVRQIAENGPCPTP